MELKQIYIDKEHIITIKGRKVLIENDKSKFKLYKKLGLNVFKDKKKIDSTK